MFTDKDKLFGSYIERLIKCEALTRKEAKDAFFTVLSNKTTEMQQGAFLAALTAKGETEDEIAGGWEAIYGADTRKVALEIGEPLVENSGTGMDSFKTFNISTAASILAAAGGVRMARHGARAISSSCGTVDMAEALGVDVECSADMVAKSIQNAGIGLFNGMSPQIHPNALGRILSQITFGSTLNIAASLANPALPKRAVRGVYAKQMLLPVARVMQAIGYERSLVVYGAIDDTDAAMDEASVCGTTYCAEFGFDSGIQEYEIRPSDVGVGHYSPDTLAPEQDRQKEACKLVALINGQGDQARLDAALFNAGLVYYVSGQSDTIRDGVRKAHDILDSQLAFQTLESWVMCQNRDPEKGVQRLRTLA